MAAPPSSPLSTAQVTQLDWAADGRWDAYVETHPDGLVYHHSGWLRALAAEYGQRAIGLACEDAGGCLRGVLPLVSTRGLPFGRGELTGRRLSSLPRTPVAGPIADDDRARAALLSAALGRARGSRRMQLQIKAAGEPLDELVPGLVGVPWRLSFARELPDDPGALRFGSSRKHAAVRRAVKTAEGAGVRVRDAETIDELRQWYVTYLDAMRDHLVPPRPLRLFEAMWQEMRPRGLMRLLLAEQPGADGRASGAAGLPLGGLVLLMLGGTVFYAFNGRRPEALELRVNDLLQWHAIHDACRAGYRFYDLGEVVEGDAGLAQFKRKWASEQRRLRRYYFPPPASGDAAQQRGPDGRLRRLAESAWRRMPLRATAIAGDRLYRYL